MSNNFINPCKLYFNGLNTFCISKIMFTRRVYLYFIVYKELLRKEEKLSLTFW